MAEPSNDVVHYVNKTTGKSEVLVKSTGEVFPLEKFYAPRVKMKYSLEPARQICAYIRAGYSFAQIADIKGMPDVETIHHWKRIHPDFKEAIEIARQDSAERFASLAVQLATSALEKDQVPAAKLAVDTLKWYAEKSSPEQFGNKTVVEGNADKPITIVVDTGIRRE